MIELAQDSLKFRFPEVHNDAACSINFQRTLRIPDDNREYPLPPGLGSFPMEHIEDHKKRVPSEWVNHGGVFLPMYQSEALWVNFYGKYPCAVKIATGKIDAVTGNDWTDELSRYPQDYIVIPDQPWLDGYCIQKGLIRQFVAMPLGQGYTIEEQINASVQHGGIQLIVYPMKRDRYEAMSKNRSEIVYEDVLYCKYASNVMGLAPGGLMRQEIYEDAYGFDAWDMEHSSRCFVHILNSAQWEQVTGTLAPGEPLSASDYTMYGLPWFDYYDDKLSALKGGDKLSGLDGIAAKGIKLGEKPLQGNDPIQTEKLTHILPKSASVKEGQW